MENKQAIWYVMFCDEWRSNNSCRLQMLTTDSWKIRDFLYKAIQNEDVEYYDTDMTPKEQAEQFLEDWDKERRDVINNNLVYAYYDYSYDGDEM